MQIKTCEGGLASLLRIAGTLIDKEGCVNPGKKRGVLHWVWITE